MYFLTLLNSTTLQFFVLHHCQYDQQGRMRLFRESMAKIPFQDRDVKIHPERIGYVAQLGASMVELKDVLYDVVVAWRLTGSHHGSGVVPPPPPPLTSGSAATNGRRGSTGGLASSGPFPAVGGGAGPSTGGGSNQGLLDWIRKGGNPPPGLLSRVKEQVRRMLVAQANHHRHQQHRQYQYQHQHQHQYQPPLAGIGGATHVSKTVITSSSAPSSSSPSSMLHLNKKSRDFRTGAMMMGSGPFFTDTDTDTNTFTDTDTDTDDTMDPWVASRRVISTSSAANAAGYLQQQQNRGGRTQGQHSLARILNMPGDDEGEVSMDEEGNALMTDSPQTMPMPIPEVSRDRRGIRLTMNSGFGHDEEDEDVEEQNRTLDN
ncbi:hypothetical protein BGX24_006761, partial [Mortierella sp. AD032]